MTSGLPKVLNVAEKNDAARELAKIMSRNHFQRREGFSKFNKIYEFTQHILGKECKMVMTSVSGHLQTLNFIFAYRKWNNCPPVRLFDADIEKTVQDDFIPIKRTLQREIRGCEDLILWTDGDREGENIAAEIASVCLEVKKRIRIHRARFSEITQQSVARACATLGTLDQRMVDAVEARQEVDLRIGCAFTRFQTMRLRKVFPQVLSDQLISYGPCQFPTLGFVVDRYKEIQAFIPETFYKIKVTHLYENDKVDFNWKRGRLFNHTCCLILYQICMEAPQACVVNIQSKARSKWRPLPLDTVEMEKLCSRKLRINAKETMKIAEKLYTQGFISYPRTETNIFPPSFDLDSIVREQTQDATWGGFANHLLATGPNPRQGTKSDNAHPPIYPTKYTNSLQGNEQRIYEFVVRHFLACCSKNAEGHETTVEIDIAGERFIAQGLMIVARNYLDIYPYDKWSDKTLPIYQMNSTFQPSSIEMVEGETNPPSLLQEADLIALMEKHGIGTDATHSEHIETIKTRRYVGVQSDGSFVPGELGIGLVEGYDSMGYQLSKPKLRAELEADLKRICEGQQTKDAVITETLDKYKRFFIQANSQAKKLDEALSQYFGSPQEYNEENEAPILSELVRKCPHCQEGNLVVKKKKDGGFMLSCLRYPQCTTVQYFPSSVIEAEPDSSLCTQCQPAPVHLLKLKFKPGAVSHGINLDYVGCTTCDHILINELGFRPIKQSTSTTNTTSTRGRGQSRGRRGGSTQRGQSSGSGWGGPPSPPPPPGPSPSSNGCWNPSFPSSSAGHHSYPPSCQSNLAASSPIVSRVGMIGGGVGGVVCMCGEEAILLTVRNEQSANKGRQFYKCSKRDEGKCNFFLWADEANTGVDSPYSSSHSSYNSQGRSSGSGFLYTKRGRGGGSSGVGRGGLTCRCGLQAVQKTVHQGQNQGRPFHTCPKPREEQCGFFEWADVPSGRGQGSGNKTRARPASIANDGDNGPAPKKRAPPTCSICSILGHTKRTCPIVK